MRKLDLEQHFLSCSNKSAPHAPGWVEGNGELFVYLLCLKLFCSRAGGSWFFFRMWLCCRYISHNNTQLRLNHTAGSSSLVISYLNLLVSHCRGLLPKLVLCGTKGFRDWSLCWSQLGMGL